MANQFLDQTGLAHVFSKMKTLVGAKQDALTFDSAPTQDSTNPVTSGGVYASLEKIAEGSGTSPGGNVWMGTCATATSTAAKVVATYTGDFTLETGSMVFIKMTYANSAADPTLNIDGTGAKSLRYMGTFSTAYTWNAGEVIGVVYDGTNYVMVEGGQATTTYYGVTKLSTSTSSTSTSLAATPSAVKAAYDLANTANTAAATAKSTAEAAQTAATAAQTAATMPIATGPGYDEDFVTGDMYYLMAREATTPTGCSTLNEMGISWQLVKYSAPSVPTPSEAGVTDGVLRCSGNSLYWQDMTEFAEEVAGYIPV